MRSEAVTEQEAVQVADEGVEAGRDRVEAADHAGQRRAENEAGAVQCLVEVQAVGDVEIQT
jgi:hypothetical protein